VSRRGFGVAAGLDPEIATPLAARCAELGYSSMWSNDHPAALGLETLAAFAEGSDDVELGVAVMALDRHDPIEINAAIERLGLDRNRIWLGVGAGFSKKPLTRMREIEPQLRDPVLARTLRQRRRRTRLSALDGAHVGLLGG